MPRHFMKFLLTLIGLTLSLKAYGAVAPIADVNKIHEAFVSQYNQITPPAPIQKALPQPFAEQIPAQPSSDTIWIPGYWRWNAIQNDYIWICGVWRRPPTNHIWIAGQWFNNGQGWVWEYGFWSPVSLQNLVYIDKQPPALINENVPPSPGNDFFWAPGYWEYAASTKNYTWLTGNWTKFDQNWILSPGSYTWRQKGFVFVPMYWDWPLEKRGYAYSCSASNVQPVVIAPEVIIQQLYFYYPSYVSIYWHWWHFHPGWWDDCFCAPPWWFWPDWWTFPCDEMWGLWWWWGHPGFFPPFWLSLELSLEIAPPPILVIDMFKKINKPPFTVKPGDKPLLPQGPPGIPNVPKPTVPNDVTPGGSIVTPPTPPRGVTPPPPPPAPSTPETPRPYYPPSGQQQPPSYAPPEYLEPPTYVPPSRREPPSYYPPRGQEPPSYTPPRGQQPPSYTPPSYKPPGRYTPPSTNVPGGSQPRPNSPTYPSGSQNQGQGKGRYR